MLYNFPIPKSMVCFMIFSTKHLQWSFFSDVNLQSSTHSPLNQRTDHLLNSTSILTSIQTKSDQTDMGSNSSGTIAAVVTVLAFLILLLLVAVIVVVIITCWRKKKSGYTTLFFGNASLTRGLTNLLYEKNSKSINDSEQNNLSNPIYVGEYNQKPIVKCIQR